MAGVLRRPQHGGEGATGGAAAPGVAADLGADGERPVEAADGVRDAPRAVPVQKLAGPQTDAPGGAADANAVVRLRGNNPGHLSIHTYTA